MARGYAYNVRTPAQKMIVLPIAKIFLLFREYLFRGLFVVVKHLQLIPRVIPGITLSRV